MGLPDELNLLIPYDVDVIVYLALDGATVFGIIELTEDAVVLRTNSPARAQRGQSLLT